MSKPMTRYHKILSLIFLAVWAWAAIYPTHPAEWLLENFLVFLFVGILFITAKHFTFSNASYTMMLIFLVFHLAGSHYAYTQVPFGYTLQAWFGESRNMYDRLVHLLFGAMFAYPTYEFAKRVVKTRGFLTYFFAFSAIMASSAVYEIIEWLSVASIGPNLDTYFVGAQGDVWDTQKDMAMAALGSIACLVTYVVYRKTWKKTENTVQHR